MDRERERERDGDESVFWSEIAENPRNGKKLSMTWTSHRSDTSPLRLDCAGYDEYGVLL